MVEPGCEDVLERDAKLAPTVSKELGEQFLAIAEVMCDAGVGHTDPRGHRAYLHGGNASLGEQESRSVEDQPTSLTCVPSRS